MHQASFDIDRTRHHEILFSLSLLISIHTIFNLRARHARMIYTKQVAFRIIPAFHLDWMSLRLWLSYHNS